MNEQITSRLREAADDVPVPAIDEFAFARRVRHHRTRRRGLVAAGSVGLAAAVVAPVLGLPLVLDALDDSPERQPEVATGPGGPGSLGTVAFVLDGRLHVQSPDRYAGGARDTGIRVQDVLAVRGEEVLAVDPESRVIAVPVEGGTPTRPLGAQAVQSAYVGGDGTLSWVDLSGDVWKQEPGREPVRGLGVNGTDQWVYDFDGRRWAAGEEGTATLSITDGEDGRLVEVDDAMTRADLAADTVAVTEPAGTRFVDVATGRTRGRTDLTGHGVLNPDGRWYVGAPDAQEIDEGAQRTLWRWDTSSGDAQEFAGFDDTGSVVDAAWQGDRALVVVETYTDDGATLHTLYSCSPESLRCDYHYEDETGTLRLPTS